MTIQPISTTDMYSTASGSIQNKPAPSSSGTPQDTVHLSPQAQASIDKDHDGDSH